MAKKIKEQDINYDKNSLYFGYSTRVSILIVLFAILAVISGMLAYKLINYKEANNVRFIEIGKITHQAILKENNIYDKNVIDEKEKVKYLSSLTDKIKLNYDYKINFDRKVEGINKTSIIGDITIYNSKTNTNYYIKRVNLVDEENKIFTSKKVKYNKSVLIDYNKYNELAKEFKNKYSKDSAAKMNVYLDVNTTISPVDYNTYKRTNSKLLASISLGKEEIEIIKSSLDNTKVVPYKQRTTTTYSIILEGLIILFVTFLIIVFYRLNKLLSKLEPKETEYDKELKRILEEYDSIIVNVSILPGENEYKKVVINDFQELLDLRESVKEPIRYIEIAPRNKSYFFIKHNDEVFIYTLKNTSKER